MVLFALVLNSSVCSAQSSYEFYAFGINLKTFKDCNWMAVAAGAVSSILVHEMGHAVYLESQGKDWRFTTSPSGFAVRTSDHLSDSQYHNFGRAGFALQTGIGALLTFFESTRHSDFTKGWVSINAAGIYTYNMRSHDDSNDFDLIEKGHGDWMLEFGMLAFASRNNMAAALNPPMSLFETMFEVKKEADFFHDGNQWLASATLNPTWEPDLSFDPEKENTAYLTDLKRRYPLLFSPPFYYLASAK
jgi:hypothetical protein